MTAVDDEPFVFRQRGGAKNQMPGFDMQRPREMAGSPFRILAHVQYVWPYAVLSFLIQFYDGRELNTCTRRAFRVLRTHSAYEEAAQIVIADPDQLADGLIARSRIPHDQKDRRGEGQYKPNLPVFVSAAVAESLLQLAALRSCGSRPNVQTSMRV